MNTKGGEVDRVRNDYLNSMNRDKFAVNNLDENKVENNKDSNISSLVASNTNANVIGGTSKSNNHGGHRVGNKKDGPARNMNSERRRREKLSKGLLELRSAVPRISKMDNPSTLRDAIDYLKELRQKVSELELELELLQPAAATPPVTTGFSQLTPSAATIPSCSTKDLVPIREPAKVDVQQIKKGLLDIHIFCGPKPDLLYSITKTLNDHGLTIRDGMMGCFDDFKLDFQAQQTNGGQSVNPDQIKAILLDLVGDRGAPEV